METHQIAVLVVAVPALAWCINRLGGLLYEVIRDATYGATISKHIMKKQVPYLHDRINALERRLAALEKKGGE